MDTKNVIIAVILSTIVLIFWGTFFEPPVIEEKNIENQIKPYFVLEEGGDENATEYPRINNFFFVSTSTRIFIGASTEDPNNIKKKVTAVRKANVFIKKLKKTLIIYNILILDWKLRFLKKK